VDGRHKAGHDDRGARTAIKFAGDDPKKTRFPNFFGSNALISAISPKEKFGKICRREIRLLRKPLISQRYKEMLMSAFCTESRESLQNACKARDSNF
jgi:hypothetical protein